MLTEFGKRLPATAMQWGVTLQGTRAAMAYKADELPAPLLAALVAISTFTDGASWSIDARVIGLGVAAIALWRRLPFVVVVIAAAAISSKTVISLFSATKKTMCLL